MSAIAQHLIMRLWDGRVIARTDTERRTIATIVIQHGRKFGLLSFRLADTHIHTFNGCGRDPAGSFSQKVKTGIKRQLRLDVGFAPTSYIPVLSQRHLENVFTYTLDQDRKHGSLVDPFHEGSILLDLLGMRVIGAYAAANVRTFLPRVNRGQLLGHLGVEVDLDGPIDSYDQLTAAAAAAVGLPDLDGQKPEVVEARRAAVQVVGTSLSTRELSRLLGRCERTIKDARVRSVESKLVRAVHRQLCFRRAVELARASADRLV